MPPTLRAPFILLLLLICAVSSSKGTIEIAEQPTKQDAVKNFSKSQEQASSVSSSVSTPTSSVSTPSSSVSQSSSVSSNSGSSSSTTDPALTKSTSAFIESVLDALKRKKLLTKEKMERRAIEASIGNSSRSSSSDDDDDDDDDSDDISSDDFAIDAEHCGEHFWCGEGSNKCIPDVWVCDNMEDCKSGLFVLFGSGGLINITEMRLFVEISQLSYLNSQPFFSPLVLSKANHLAVQDEKHCNKTFRCPANTLVCNNGLCVDATFRCNGLDDCGDGTDELNCPEKSEVSSVWCPQNMYRCIRGPCVSKDSICDGFKDCPQMEDETGCTEQQRSCSENKFKCETGGNCIPIPWVCDENPDCPDRSDEIYCENGVRIPERDEYRNRKAPICGRHEFTCHDGRCIDRFLLCDGHHDCFDFSDEGGLCGACPRMGCEWECRANPLFPTCVCPEGKKLRFDGKTCSDVDECLEDSSGCAHFCQNEDGGFECFCAEGYELALDGKQCRLQEDKVGYLFVSVNSEVRKLPLFPDKEKDEVYSRVVGTSDHISDNIVGLDFDTVADVLYLTVAESGGMKGEIHYLTNTEQRREHRCLFTGFQGLSNVAADWVTGNVYYTVSGTANQPGVGVCTPDGRFCRMIVSGAGIHRVRAVALHPRRRMLYWSDWDARMPRIEMAEMDGTNRRILVHDKIVWPNGLAIDYVREQLYWSDGDLKMIERIDLRTEKRQVVVSRGIHHANELIVFADKVIWGDWEIESVVSTDLWNTTDRQIIHSMPGIPYGLAIDHPAYQKAGISNPCAQANCTHMCVLAATKQEEYTCLCPQGYRGGVLAGSCELDDQQLLDRRPRMCNLEFRRLCDDVDSESPCLNQGWCSIQEDSARCMCADGFDGQFCEYWSGKSSNEAMRLESPSAVGWLVPLLIVLLVLLVLGVIVGVYIRKSGLAGKRTPSNSTPLRKASTISFSKFRRQQEQERERMVKNEQQALYLDKVESFGNPLYEDEFGQQANVHKTVLALSGANPKEANVYYSVIDSDSGIDQVSEGSATA